MLGNKHESYKHAVNLKWNKYTPSSFSVQNPDIQQLLQQAQTFKWKHLSADDYKGAGSWFLQSCDPKCLLHGRTAPEALGLRFVGFKTHLYLA